MSTTNAPAYCEVDDVRTAMQEATGNMNGPLADDIVEAAIFAASRWLRSSAGSHWYDSNAAASDLIDTTPATTTDRTLDVPSSPHAQRGQLFHASDTTSNQQYPVTHAGRYCRLRLPVDHVESIDALRVRDIGGNVTDWVADAEITEGRGEDYYLRVEGDAMGKSYLYVHAGTLGAHIDFDEVVEVDVSYGRDWDASPWDDVRRGVAALAGAQSVDDDDIISQVPDQGQLISVETKAQNLLNQAFDQPGYLSSYVPTHPVA